MSESEINTEARKRVLEAAERLFAQKGYKAVTLRDIAATVGIRHTSLYHHAPGGKQALFIEVTERNLERHRSGLEQAIAQATPDVRAKLRAMADWLLSQPPMDLVRMIYSDISAIDPIHAERLSWLAFDALLSPIAATLHRAQQNGEIEHHNLGLVAGGLLGMIESLYAIPANAFASNSQTMEQQRETMAHELIDVILAGLHHHDSSV